MMRERKGILETMNNCIVANNKQGVYNGCKVAVELAHEMAGYKLKSSAPPPPSPAPPPPPSPAPKSASAEAPPAA
jgi:hypothetical protein